MAKEAVGVDASLTVSKDEYKGQRPVALYVGYAGGAEVTGGVTGGHTWSFEQVAAFFGLKP